MDKYTKRSSAKQDKWHYDYCKNRHDALVKAIETLEKIKRDLDRWSLPSHAVHAATNATGDSLREAQQSMREAQEQYLRSVSEYIGHWNMGR